MALKGKKFHKLGSAFVECGEGKADSETQIDTMVPVSPTCDVKKYKPVKDADGHYRFVRAHVGHGPAKYNSDQFRRGWDQVFGDGDDEGAGGMSN